MSARTGEREFLADDDIVIRAHFYDDDTFRLCINIPARLGRLICSRRIPMALYPAVENAFDFGETEGD